MPLELTPYIDARLQVHSEVLQSTAKKKGRTGGIGGHLGSTATVADAQRDDPGADQMPYQASRWQARLAHLFRDCAVTELLDSAPDDIGIAADLLGTPIYKPRPSITSWQRAGPRLRASKK